MIVKIENGFVEIDDKYSFLLSQLVYMDRREPAVLRLQVGLSFIDLKCEEAAEIDSIIGTFKKAIKYTIQEQIKRREEDRIRNNYAVNTQVKVAEKIGAF